MKKKPNQEQYLDFQVEVDKSKVKQSDQPPTLSDAVDKYFETTPPDQIRADVAEIAASHTPTIADLLREIEPWCEWLEIIDDEVYVEHRYGCPIRIAGKADIIAIKLFHRDLLGAICAECESRKWIYHLLNHYDQWRFQIALYGIAGWIKSDSDKSRCHAALLAFRDALRAAAVCPECDGRKRFLQFIDWKKQVHECPECNGTGKASEVE